MKNYEDTEYGGTARGSLQVRDLGQTPILFCALKASRALGNQ